MCFLCFTHLKTSFLHNAYLNTIERLLSKPIPTALKSRPLQFKATELRAAGHKHYHGTCSECEQQFKFYKWSATNLLHYPDSSVSPGHKGTNSRIISGCHGYKF